MIAQIAHLPFYASDPRCAVLSICESRPSLVEVLREQFGRDRVIGEYETLLADQNIDAVIVSAPRPATGPLTLAVLSAGKHAMVEKPMAHSVEQAEQLVNVAAARRLIYAVGFMKRYDPGIEVAKALFDEIIAEGRLGRLLLARFYDFSSSYAVPPPAHTRPKESRSRRFPQWPLYPQWLPERWRSSFAWFCNSASHDVNLIRYFFPEDIQVQSAHCSADESVVATFSAGETNIVLEVAKSTCGIWLEGIEFIFERGRISVTIPSPMATQSNSEIRLDDLQRGIVGANIPVSPGWSFARQATAFVDTLTGRSQPLTSGEDGLRDLLLTEEIWRRVGH